MIKIKDISTEEIKSLYDEALKYKSDIKSDYNTVFELTSSTFKIEDSGAKTTYSRRDTKPIVTESASFLLNYLMTSLFSRTNTWAVLEVNESAYSELSDDETDGTLREQTIKEINEAMEENSNLVWTYNNNSNYYAETSKALQDCINAGTGVRKIIELNSNVKPFTYEYQSLDNIYILEDSFGQPTNVFKEYVELTRKKLTDIFSSSASFKIPKGFSDETDFKATANFIECIVSDFDESTSTYKYHQKVFTKDFSEIIVDEILEYNPYTVFRWKTESSNPYGKGIAYSNLNTIQKYIEFEDLREKHAKQIVEPPIGWRGNIDLMYKASLKAGARNYLGSGVSGQDNLGLEVLNKGINLIPLENDISILKNDIREMYMAQPLGDVGDTRNRSATEMGIRHELFRTKFAGTYELINTELLQPTFMSAYIILKKKDLLKKQNEETKALNNITEISNIVYINALTLSSGANEVSSVINWYFSCLQVIGEDKKELLLDFPAFIKWSSEKTRIPLSLVKSEEEIKQGLDYITQIMQMQQLGGIQGQGLNIEGMLKQIGVGANEV